MMTEKYPTWLIGHVKEWAEKRLPTVILCSTTGNELLEVWYYGDLLTVKGEPQSYIIDSDEAPGLVTARDPESGEEFVIFDGGRHGYDNMFCDEHDPSELEHRPLKRYEIPASKLVLELGYSVDYEDEKEDFEPDEADTVELINGERMPWEQVKRDGIDYIALYYVNEERKTSPDTGRRVGMSMVIQSFDNLHDNRVLRCCADFEAHTLHMDTRTEAGEKVSVRFTGLLAHWFENVVQDNILFGMDEITVDGFFEQYKDLLGRTISYGFPACCSIEELRKRMEREHIRVFVIDSSLGLCGFVLAKEVELQCQSLLIK